MLRAGKDQHLFGRLANSILTPATNFCPCRILTNTLPFHGRKWGLIPRRDTKLAWLGTSSVLAEKLVFIAKQPLPSQANTFIYRWVSSLSGISNPLITGRKRVRIPRDPPPAGACWIVMVTDNLSIQHSETASTFCGYNIVG